MNDEKVTEREGFRQALVEKVCSRTDFPSNRQNIHTPFALCGEMVEQLKQHTELADKTFLALNLEFVDVLCDDYGVKRESIWFVTDCQQKANVVKHHRYNGVNVVVADYLTWEPNMKFYVIVGNPPYQTKSAEDDTKTQAIWPLFIEQTNKLIQKDGYICLVHPSGWRDIAGMFKKTQENILSNDIQYLEMHSETDGVRIFGATTTYDWYVSQNKSSTKNTIVKSQDGSITTMDISDMPFIPNGMFESVKSLIAKKGEEKVDVARDATHCHTQKEWMSKEQIGEFQYPCVYTTEKKGTINFWYSNTNENGHFGIPKVFWSNGAASSVHVDESGQYGLTQFAYGIIDKKENLENIKKAMNHPKFIEIMEYCSLGKSHKYSYKVIATFRKDFWKQFVDENGNELK